MLPPGESSWWAYAAPMAFVLVLLFAPGLLAAVMLRLPPVPAVAVAPAMSIALVTGAGWVLGLTSVRWSPGVSLLLVGVPAVAVALIMVLVPAVRRPWQDAVQRGSRQLWFAVAAVTASASLVVVIAVTAMRDPAAIPQQPDTIFHLGVVTSMGNDGVLSAIGAQDFLGYAPSGYPLGFHVVAAATMAATGSTATVACTAVALVAAAVVWPICLSAFGATAAPSTPLRVTAPLAGVLFAALPFFPMGYGVLWPFMVGFCLVPGVLAMVHVAVVHRGSLRTVPAVVALALCLVGLYVTHPSAVLGALVYTCCMVGVALGVGATRSNSRGLGLIAAGLVVALPAFALAALARPGMVASSVVGPDATWSGVAWDVAAAAPLEAAPAWLAMAFVLVGLVRPRGAWPDLAWVWLAALGSTVVYVLNVAIDSPPLRLLTWPWYNNPPRVAVMTALPLVLLAGWGATVLARRVGDLRGRTIHRYVVVALCVGVVLAGVDAFARHAALLRPYYAPSADRWWITPDEAAALRDLAIGVPPDSGVVANPWLGSTFTYVMSGTHMFFPTEKPRWTTDERVIADLAGSVKPGAEVCEALERQGVRYAIVGGDAPIYGRVSAERDFRGVALIPDSEGWQLERAAGAFQLFRLTGC